MRYLYFVTDVLFDMFDREMVFNFIIYALLLRHPNITK